MTLPPGIVYLGLNFHYLVIPPACVYAIDRIVVEFFEYQIPWWLFILASVLAFPAVFTTVVLYKLHVDESEAAAHGAVLPPRLLDKSIGGYETLSRRLDQSKSKFIGEFMNSICEQHGNTVNMRMLFENRIFTCEPENIKMILATQFNGFEKGVFNSHMTSLLGTGVFNSDGETWKFHRAMTRPFFSKERIGHFDIFDKHAEDAIGQTKTRVEQGYPIDFQDMVSRFTLDSATEFLFGNNVRSLSAGLPYPGNSPLTASHDLSHPANIFAHAFGEAQKLSSLRSRYGSAWPLVEFWKDNVKVHRDVIDKFIDPILVEAIKKKKAAIDASGMKDGEREVKDGETLLDHLVNYTEDPKVLKDETMNIMIAGRDTTAATLTFIIYMLAEHPEVMIRLREEIMQMVGSSRRPTYDDLRDMKYMRAVINETLRLFPPVPFNVRTTTHAAIWPSKTGGKPYYVPPRTRAPYSVFLMHRRKDLWGPDALDFDPNRWLDQRLHKYLTPNPFIFLPFNAGPRICLGQQFAYNETSFFLIRFLQSFSSVSLAPDTQPLRSRPPADWATAPGRKGIEKIMIKSHLTMYALDGLWVRLEEGNDAETL